MGRIVKFPIIVDTTKATETNVGLSDVLASTVRPMNTASVAQMASEEAIREALTGLTQETSAYVSGSGYSIFYDYGTDGDAITVRFRPIKPESIFSFVQSDDSIWLTTSQADDVPSGKFVNSGVEQEATTIYPDSDFGFASGSYFANTNYASGGAPIFYNVQNGIAIGKIMMKCTQAFATGYGDEYLSIGTDEDPEAFVQKFLAPTSVTTDRLVDFKYGRYLWDKIEYKDIGGGSRLGIGYFFGGADTYAIQFLRIASSTFYMSSAQTLRLQSSVETPGQYNAAWSVYDSVYTWIGSDYGGGDAATLNHSFKYIYSNDTSEYYLNLDSDNEHGKAASRILGTLAGYMLGGYNNTTNITKLQYQNETLSTITSLLTEGVMDRAGFTNISNREEGYYCSANTTTELAKIYKFAFSTDTPTLKATSTYDFYYSGAAWTYDNLYVIGGGYSNFSTNSLKIHKYVISTSSLSENISITNPFSNSAASVVMNENYTAAYITKYLTARMAYGGGGAATTLTQSNTCLKFQFSTSTISTTTAVAISETDLTVGACWQQTSDT